MDFQQTHSAGGPRHNSYSSAEGDFKNNDSRNSRGDNLAHTSQLRSNQFEISSPGSADYNFPLSGSPRTSISGGFDNSRLQGPGSLSAYGPTSGSLPGQQSNMSNAGFDSFSNRNGSIGASEQWSPTGVAFTGLSGPNEMGNDAGSNATKDSDHGKDGDDPDKIPMWSELRTKAGKERKRLPLACIACRRKKIRCSGEKPACKHCVRARIPCVYKVTARKAAPRTDYMAMLDKRLKRMEERVIKVLPKEDLPDLNATGRASVRPPIPGQISKPTKPVPTKKRSADEAFVQELNGWTQAESKKSISAPLARSRNQKEGENQLFVEGADFLPPIYLQEHLAEVFFDCIYGQSYLLLHKPSFMRKLKTGSVPPVLILAVCAIAARFSTHPQVSGEPAFLRGDAWATPARNIVEKRHYEPNITILTVMLILGLHYFGTCEGGLSWSFGGQAMRMAYALQLHRELDHDPLGQKNDKASKLSFTDREIRRRTMWACFLMDTFNSSGTERPSFGNEDYMHIQLPVKESHFQMEVPGPTEDLEGNVPNPISSGIGQVSNPKENMGVAAYVIRAVVLWKRIVKYLNLGGKEKDPHPIWDSLSQFADLRRQLNRLRDNLPSHLTFTNENLQNHSSERVANQFLHLHIIHAQNSLFLNRFAIPLAPTARPPKDMPKQFLSDAARDVVEAASQISRLIEQANSHMLTVPFAGYCAYASSTVHVWGIFSKNDNLETTSKENLRHNYKYLNRMKQHWGMFHYMAESIKDIYRRFADAAMRGQKAQQQDLASNPKNSNAMFQYGDWFDKYPHGVSETEWEDEHRTFKKEHGAEAVMSQRSDLQSVEEFFASLSPPTSGVGASKVRKVPRRRGKSAVEGRKQAEEGGGIDTTTTTAAAASQQQPQLFNQQDFNSMYQTPPTCGAGTTPGDPGNFVSPVAGGAYDFSTSQTQFSPTDTSMNFNNNNNNNFNSNPLPQLDRQLVFGAYAGLDPMMNANLNQNPWDMSGMDMSGMDFGMGAGGGFGGDLAMGSSAWLMPFNMEPPVVGSGAGGGADWVIFDDASGSASGFGAGQEGGDGMADGE